MTRVTALEIPARFGEPERALADVRTAMASAPLGELVLLPECCLTGYVNRAHEFDLSAFAEPLTGPTMAIYKALAAQHQVHLVGPIVEADGETLFNTMVVVAPDGRLVAHYRKRHPWYPETWASPGTFAYPSFELGGLVFTLAICFDVHFLAREASATLDASDVLLLPSAWVDDGDVDLREGIFQRLVRRFKLTVVNANWAKGVPLFQGQGRSRIVTAAGAVLEAPERPGAWSRIDAAL